MRRPCRRTTGPSSSSSGANSMDTSLDEKVALVTGASRGIGRAIAIALGRKGATVALLARSEVGLRETATAVEAAGGRALVLAADVTDHGAVSRAVALVARDAGRVDILVNNAGL